MSLRLHAFNLMSAILPSRGGMWLRRSLLIAAGAKVRDKVRIAHGVRVYDRYLSVGEATWIGMGTRLVSNRAGAIVIGARVDIGPGCLIATGSHELGGPSRRAGRGTAEAITIGDGSWVGMHSTILGGARIGRGCVVAAGSVVTKGEYPDNVLLAGVPARVKKQLGNGGSAA